MELNGVSANAVLRRFIDLPKLFDLLKNKRLFLPSLRQLIGGDPSECFAKKNFDHLGRPKLEQRAKELEEYAPDEMKGFKYPPGITNVWEKIGVGKSLFEHLIQTISDNELKKVVWQLERERLKGDLVCCCWYKGTGESDAMWKIYAAQLGVMFTTSPNRMESAIKLILPKIYAERTKLKLAAVHYEDVDECGSLEPWLIKREAFKHEEEVRLYCDKPSASFKIVVNLPELIEEIVITPFGEKWQLIGIKAAIEALLKEVGASQIPVRLSDHMRPPEITWPKEQKTLSEALAVRPIIGHLFSQKMGDLLLELAVQIEF